MGEREKEAEKRLEPLSSPGVQRVRSGSFDDMAGREVKARLRRAMNEKQGIIKPVFHKNYLYVPTSLSI